MPSVSESLTAKSPLGSALAAGADTLSYSQSVTFTKYIRLVLPLDGYVYWVNAGLVNNAAIMNAQQFNAAQMNQTSQASTAVTIEIEGSFHFNVQRSQIEDQTIDIKQCIFTSESRIDDFGVVGPKVMWIGQFLDFRFAFSRQSNFYQQVDLYHYVGDAIYPDMETQIIDDLNGLNTRDVVVSNSLPIWLAMNAANPPFPWPASQAIDLYPSFLVPDDVAPPYGAVNIQPEMTEALTAAPVINCVSSHYQLTKDVVNITLLGLSNSAALDFVDYVLNLSIQDDANFGIMNIPIVRDLKRTQSEISAIAMKKSVTFEINYYQSRVRQIAQQYILSVIINYELGV